MRLLSRFHVHTSARFLEDEYSIYYTTILRHGKEVLENDDLKLKLHDVQGVLIDKKHLAPNQGFVTLSLKLSEAPKKVQDLTFSVASKFETDPFLLFGFSNCLIILCLVI